MCWQRDREGGDRCPTEGKKGNEFERNWYVVTYTASNNGGAHNYRREGQPNFLL